MLVKDVMTRKVVTVPQNTTFARILQVFKKHKISGAPVVDKKNRMLGIVSEKDLLYKLFPSEKDFYKNVEYYFSRNHRDEDLVRVRKIKADKIMTRDVVYVNEDDHVLTACAMLLIHNIRRLPVLRGGKIIGIVTTNNVFRNYLTHTTLK